MLSPIAYQIDLANTLTLIGLLLSFYSALFAGQGLFYSALLCMICAGIVDLFDGLIARNIQRTELQSQVGKQLDSIVDICSFGFAPVIFAYYFGLQDPLSVLILIFYLGATALRLAYFNTTGLVIEGKKEYFTGLPVTYTALFIPLACLGIFILPKLELKLLLDSVYFVLAISMLGNFKLLKLKGIWYIFFSILALGGMIIYGGAIIFNW
jgi:CDP-diacylglycerol--serine O-phosphatidyltransferase